MPVILVGLVLLTLAAYWGVGRCGFVNLDDDAYVEHQPMVNQGLRPAAVVWAFTAVHSSNWHPLTSLSHMIDCDLFGVRAGPMHWENLLWHILNGVLVFLVWRTLTGATWRSACVAGLFALHPLHVESVAWISERKDLLSTFFWLLGIAAYAAYVRRPSPLRYARVALALVCALLSKPMAVTFPCTLLLLDFWPLRRWPGTGWAALVREKIPLFLLVLVHSVTTYFVQHSAGAADFGQRLTLAARGANALVAYARYLGKTAWPDSLTPFYPHPGHWPVWAVSGALAALIGASALVWKWAPTRGWLAFGWLWFLGTLVPVIGIVQVGAQSMAERYTYVPLLGIFTIIAWEGAALLAAIPRLRLPVIGAAAVVLGGCLLLTNRRVPAWETSIQLYERSIASGQDNATIRYLLGVAVQAAGRPESEAVAHFRRALAFEPDYINAGTQLAVIALQHLRTDEALRLLEANRAAQPRNPGVHKNLGALCALQNKLDEAIVHFNTALRLDPRYAEAHHELSKIFVTQNRLDDARRELEAFVRLAPWSAEQLCELGTLLANLRDFDRARACLERAHWIRPDLTAARENLRTLEQLTRRPP